MGDPYCQECHKVTGGCWQHGGSGIYKSMPDGSFLQTHAPMVVVSGGVMIFYMRPLYPEGETSVGAPRQVPIQDSYSTANGGFY